MLFSSEEISLATQLRRHGLDWEPSPGHYVYDATGFCKQKSPFQDSVYFILNYPYFVRAVGGVQRFKEIMIWLPTWEDARNILASLQVSDDKIALHLNHSGSIERQTERITLLRLIDKLLHKQ